MHFVVSMETIHTEVVADGQPLLSSAEVVSKVISCRCLTTKLFEVYLEEIDCRHELAEIRIRWCKEYKDLDRYGPPERNTLLPVCWFVLS